MTFPIFVNAGDDYIGESPGLDFYSTIDDGNYTITSKMVKVRLVDTPTLDTFGKDCPKAELLK